MTAINQQTPGPLCSHLQLGDTGPQPLYSTNVGGNLVALPIKDNEDLRLKAGKRKPATERDIATQRLLAAAYTAFDGAGRKLGIDAAEMAERLGAEGLAEIADCLGKMIDLFDHVGLNGLMLKAKRHGWTPEMVDERIAACKAARRALGKIIK